VKSRVTVILSLFAVASMIVCETGEAAVYQGSATCSIAIPNLTLSVCIDTDNNIWTAHWEGEPYLIAPIPGIFSAFAIVFEDSKGFYQSFNSFEHDLSHRGTVTIGNYAHSGCWTHCWAQWSYIFPFPGGIGIYYLPLWIDIYITWEIIGDVTGDGKVDMKDIYIVAKAFGSYPSHPRWNPNADITGTTPNVPDGKVDMRDIFLVARNFGFKS